MLVTAETHAAVFMAISEHIRPVLTVEVIAGTLLVDLSISSITCRLLPSSERCFGLKRLAKLWSTAKIMYTTLL